MLLRSLQSKCPKRAFASSVNQQELNFFANIRDWADPSGPMGPLHAYNQLRVRYIRETVLKDHLPENPNEHLRTLTALDVGCGGGILASSLGRIGFETTGLDPNENCIRQAQETVFKDEELRSRVKFETGTIEEFDKERYDIVTCMEVIEHVEGQAEFIKNLAKRVKPNGFLFMSTMAKTTESYALSIVAAEQVLGLTPSGTHDWEKFINPEDLQGMIMDTGLRVINTQGAMYNPITNKFSKVDWTGNNYMMAARSIV